MFKIGDRIRIRKERQFYPWYSENIFTVVGLENSCVYLNKNILESYTNIINVDHIIHSHIYERRYKILKIKERCLKKVMK